MTPTTAKRVQDFLSKRNIAVVGVSRKPRGSPANAIYKKLKDAKYQVYAVNPNAQKVEGDPCYPNLKAIPGTVDGVVVVVRPEYSESIVRECVELGVTRVWMHRSFGQGSVSEEAVSLCTENNIMVIAGGCPMMFCEPVDFAHKCMRWFLKVSGSLPR